MSLLCHTGQLSSSIVLLDCKICRILFYKCLACKTDFRDENSLETDRKEAERKAREDRIAAKASAGKSAAPAAPVPAPTVVAPAATTTAAPATVGASTDSLGGATARGQAPTGDPRRGGLDALAQGDVGETTTRHFDRDAPNIEGSDDDDY